MNPDQKRRAVRYLVRLPAELSVGKRSAPAEIVNAGFGGVFACTELAPGVRQLVQLQVTPPGCDNTLSFHAMVVHVVTEPNPQRRSRGVGIQFYAVDAQTRSAWDRFIHSVERAGAQTQESSLPAEMPTALLRKFLRHAAVLKVAVPDVEHLRAIYDELETGKILVPCDDDLSTGNVVFVHITHPNHPATFLLEGVVDQVVRDRVPAGAVVRFLGLKQDRVQSFLEFVDSGFDTESDVGDETPSVELGVSELLESELEEYENMPDSATDVPSGRV